MADPKKQDPYAVYGGSVAKGQDDPYAAYATKSDDDGSSRGAIGMNSPAPGMAEQTISATKDFAKNLPVGIAKGVGNTVSGVSDMIHSIPKVGPKIIPDSGLNAFHEMNKPEGVGQNVGYTGEQVGEYLLPTGLEEKAAVNISKIPKIGKAIAPLAKAGISAIETGLRNKLQGGDFQTGAVTGGIASGVGTGLKAIAPRLAESALGITKRDRGYGKTIGEAALNEIDGVRPATLAKNASVKASQIISELETLAARHPSTIDMRPAIATVDAEIAKAASQNNGTAVEHLGRVRQAITQNAIAKPPLNLSPDQSATGALQLKRGLRNQFVKNWNPDIGSEVTRDAAKKASRAIDSSLDSALGPEFASKNQRVSSLLPVASRAESIERGAGVAQRTLHRVAAHTGALTGAALGAKQGYDSGGVTGGIGGAMLGAVLPELIASPTGEMVVARGLNSDRPIAVVKGGALQLDRSKDRKKVNKGSGEGED